MNFLIFIIVITCYYFMENFIIKRQIKNNISLFYALHKKQVDKIIEDKKEDELIEKI